MSILNQIQPPDNNTYSNYDDLDTLISNMKVDREDVNEGKPKPLDDGYTKPLHPEDEASLSLPLGDAPNIPKISVITEKKAQFEAHFLAKNNDRLQSMLCSMIADDDPENYEAEDDEVDEIASYIYEWRKDSQEPLPLWLEIAAAIALIYGPKYNQAFKFRKAKKQLVIMETKNDELLIELMKLRDNIVKAKEENDILIKENKENEKLLKSKLTIVEDAVNA